MERLGLVAFEKLEYYARFKIAEASIIKRPRPHSNLNNIVKTCAGNEVDINKALNAKFWCKTK